MTQAQLAEKLGVTGFTVCRYENGQIAMPIETIRRAALIFDSCPAYFLADHRCEFGRDQELVHLLRRADHLEEAQREVVKQTLRALLDSMTGSIDPGQGRPR